MISILKFGLIISFTILSVQWSHAQKDAYEIEIGAIIADMTLEDKVGQMCQYNLQFILKPTHDPIHGKLEIDSVKLRKLIKENRVGSFLNTGGRALTVEEWSYVHNTIGYFAVEEELLPVIYGIDAVHGANYTSKSTLFPHQLGQAATWNNVLIEKAARATALECQASEIPWVFAPILDAGRQPLWGQFFETYGEDPNMSSSMARAVIRGFQNAEKGEMVAGCAKHFVGYGVPDNGKDRTTVSIAEHDLREKHLEPFIAAIDEGVMSIMVGSHDLNGIPMNANKYLLSNVLRGELGFEGVLITDWGDVRKLHETHRITKDYKASVQLAIDAGIDMAMVPEDVEFFNHLKQLVQEGVIEEQRIDESVARILLLKKQLGLLGSKKSVVPMATVGCEAHKDLAYELASESITLLENSDDLLPLATESSVLVAGVAANDVRYQIGAWGRTWQGFDSLIMDEGIGTIFSEINQTASNTIAFNAEAMKSELDYSEVDAVVVCLGEKPATEKPADITSLALHESETALVKELALLGKPMVLVLCQNRPRLLGEILEYTDAVLMAYQPGMEGSVAIADVIFGRVNPSGKLPFTYPKYEHGIGTYDHYASDAVDVDYGNSGFDPMWKFGYGLSYSKFGYKNLMVNSDSFSAGDSIRLSIEVENISEVRGKEVVQVFVSDEVASLVPPNKRLRDYTKIELEARSSKIIDLVLATEDLGFYHPGESKKRTESGWFTVRIENETKRFHVSASESDLR